MSMSKKNPFTADDSELPKKKNPHMEIARAYPPQKNKSTRVTPEDHKYFREYAHQREITMLEAITIARKLLEEHDPLD